MLKPFELFDAIKADFGLKNDAALARSLRLAPPQVSKVRNGSLACTDMVILRVHEAFGVPVGQIRFMLKEQAEHDARRAQSQEQAEHDAFRAVAGTKGPN